MISSIRALDVRPVLVRLQWVKTYEPADGGGKIPIAKNAVYMLSKAINTTQSPDIVAKTDSQHRQLIRINFNYNPYLYDLINYK